MHESSKEPHDDTVYDASHTTLSSSNEIEKSLIQNTNALASSSNLFHEGIIAGKRIAKISVVTLLAIGVVEIVTGY